MAEYFATLDEEVGRNDVRKRRNDVDLCLRGIHMNAISESGQRGISDTRVATEESLGSEREPATLFIPI